MTGKNAAGLLVLLAICCAFALAIAAFVAHSPARAQTPPGNHALAKLEIDIWPELDQPSAVLVILRAEIDPAAAPPEKISLRLPASSGGPTAVAEPAATGGQLVNLEYERADVQIDFMTITFTPTGRFFQVEFYDPVSTAAPDRDYKYIWAGDFAVAEATVQLQEPAASSGMTVTPDLGTPAAQSDGLFYRQADIGALEAGKALTVDVKYRKTDTRTSAEILGLAQPTPLGSGGGGSSWGTSRLLLLAGVIAAAVVAGAVGWLWWQRQLAAAQAARPRSRGERRRGEAGGESFCTKCSTPLDPGDKFCPSCGHPVKGRR
ncbi:MAG TPA: zinc ribbon domain-containing protein [Dehalococcoidia bacterium]|nr:zinc ribbon domain-containing protein [Dehalococcoidia bacterium]